jgi:23S rRNA (cytosine1962-C5)-methyltransferase
MYSVYLKKNEERRILEGHSWVYANEVARIEGKDKNGSVAEVFGFDGRYIGKGFINHLSKILVRIMSRSNEEIDKNFFLKKINEANNYRINLGFKDNYRVVFAESDGLPALIVDKYNDILSVQFLSLGMDLNKNVIIECLVEIFHPRGIYERSDVNVREKEGLPLFKGKIYGDFEPVAEINENGIKMLVNLEEGQKTGYFLDQKENRFSIRKFVKDKSVLDCFCNSGGFSLNAAVAGAKTVTAVDISEIALNDVNKNAEINGLQNIIKTQCGDVFQILRDYKKEGKTFDVIILDPPAFCKSASEVKDAYRGYKDINLTALKLINKGGYLITSSCSHYMSIEMFIEMLKDAASDSGKSVRVTEIRTQASDHPSLITSEETMYLKFFILNVN